MKIRVSINIFIILSIGILLNACTKNNIVKNSSGITKITNSNKTTPTSSYITTDSYLPTTLPTTIDSLDIIENQSFWTEFEKWGKVRFISSKEICGSIKLRFYLANTNNKLIYSFPKFYSEYCEHWCFTEMKAIAFKDINEDGLKDIVIIADYITGIGPECATPFHVGSVYFQKKSEFVNIPELDEKINSGRQCENMDMLINFVSGKVEGFNLKK